MTQEAKQTRGSKREPVFSGKRRVKGLYQRVLADGTIVYDARIRIDGREHKKPFGPITKTDAIRAVEDFRVSLVRGESPEAEGSTATTIEQLATDWIAHLRTRIGIGGKREVALGTVELNEQRLRDHVCDQLGTLRVDELNVGHLRRLVDRLTSKGLSPSTITSVLNITSAMMKYAVRNDLREHNPVRDLDSDEKPGAARQTEPRYLSQSDLDFLISKVGAPFQLVVLLCTYAGLRVSEALGLRWCDLDLEAGTIKVVGQIDRDGTWKSKPKTSASAATLPMLPVLKRALKEHRRAQAEKNIALVGATKLVNVTRTGKVQSRRNALRALHSAGLAAGLNEQDKDGAWIGEPVGLHDLRHSLIALAFADPTMTLPEIQALARHANVNVTTTVYAGFAGDGRKQAFGKLAESGLGS
jgi:integrase